MSLFNYQQKMVDFIREKKKVGLFVDMGMGKTLTALTSVNDLLDHDDRVLVVAPLRVCNTTWPVEIEKWFPGTTVAIATGSKANRLAAIHSGARITIINRENVKWLMEYGLVYDMLIVDESSSFKSAKSQRFKALKKLKTRYTILLSGTPAPQSLMDLWSQMFLLDQGQRLGKTITAFRNRFFTKAMFGWDIRVGSDRIIHSLIEDITMSLSASDYLDMPDKINATESVILPPEVQKRYAELVDEFVTTINDVDVEVLSAASLGNKLLQMGNGFVYADDETIVVHDKKVAALKEIIEDNPTENLLVFYNFKADLEALKLNFEGEVVTDDSIKRWNEGKVKLLFAHPASASMGLNLQYGGRIVVWFGLNWNLEFYQQGNARLHRQGQTKPVTIMHIVVSGGIDEKIMNALAGKATTQSQLLEHLRV